MRKLLLLTAVVTLIHALLLWAAPNSRPLFSGRPEGLLSQAQATGFVARSITPPSSPLPAVQAIALPRVETPAQVPLPSPVAKPTREKKLAIKPAQTAPAPAPVAVEPPAQLTPVTREPATAAQVSPVSAAVQLAVATDTSTKSRTEPAAETKAPTVAAAGSSAARTPKVIYPAPARLLYDGKGEEKGFLKYNAGGELVWAPDGTQYSAKLEITFLLARLRTWTSKGELSDNGLQPTRFGDKPRGAEQATHFQRAKGIISFSANNPDVPLQPGAQDKLSAILQLTALMAGAPARYGAGSVISFQAADAHRAELWDFKVGSSESLDLPGGTVNGIKLTKEPTVEFDQRIEVWLAPDMGYLPVRLRITEANSAFVDLLWRKTQKPD